MQGACWTPCAGHYLVRGLAVVIRTLHLSDLVTVTHPHGNNGFFAGSNRTKTVIFFHNTSKSGGLKFIKHRCNTVEIFFVFQRVRSGKRVEINVEIMLKLNR